MCARLSPACAPADCTFRPSAGRRRLPAVCRVSRAKPPRPEKGVLKVGDALTLALDAFRALACRNDPWSKPAMLKPATAALLWAFAFIPAPWAAPPLASLNGKARVLVIAAPSLADPALAIQNRWLQTNEVGLHERDVLVIRIIGRAAEATHNLTLDGQSLLQTLGLRNSKFAVVLIGKDGSKVLQKTTPITSDALFRLIDAMPMRRQEIRNRRA
jgi:hypothetical protein